MSDSIIQSAARPGNPASLEAVTLILNRARDGDADSAALAWQLVIVDLQKLARGITRGFQATRRNGAFSAGGQASGVASPTTVVHEAFLRMVDSPGSGAWESRRHFYGAMTRAMSRYLIDRSRAERSLKRGGNAMSVPLEFAQEELAELDDGVELADLGVFEALDKLEAAHPIAAEVVRLRFIAGLGQAQTAEVTGLSTRSVSKHWNFARSFLRREITRTSHPSTELPS